MKSLSKDKVLRWVSGTQSQGGSGGGGGSVDFAGYATQIWTEQNYVNKEFFSSLFKAYDADGNEVLPNDTETVIDNIKAMFGFWTDFYISALGTGGQQSVDLRLAQLADVNVAGVTNGQVLTYDNATGKWIASTPQSGTDMATVWSNLAAADNTKQIDYSHLSGAVSLSNGTITIGGSTITPITSHQSLANYFTYKGQAAEAYFGNTYSSLENGTYYRQFSGSSAALIHFKGSGSASGLDLYFAYPQDGSNPLYYRKIIDDNRFAGGWVQLIDSYGGTISGTLVLSNTNDAQGTAWNSPALCVGGSYSGAHIEIDSNEIMAKSNVSTTTTLYLNAEGGNCVINETAGNCGIGTGSPSHKLHVNGGIYSTSYVTALSDARHKDVIGDTGLTVEQIAEAPAIRFQWNDRDDQSIFAGSIAQYWQRILPEVVQSQADGTLSLDYQVAALISSITVARKVMNHESRLRRLEKMFAINENDIED